MKKIEPKKKGRGKKTKPAPIALDITETAMYESLDVENPVDYTYPKPSPTSKMNPEAATAYYTVIPTRQEGEGSSGSKEEEALYHAIGPDAAAGLRRGVGEIRVPPPVPERNNTSSSEPGGLYNLLEGAVGTLTSHYEDPTKPTFQVNV